MPATWLIVADSKAIFCFPRDRPNSEAAFMKLTASDPAKAAATTWAPDDWAWKMGSEKSCSFRAVRVDPMIVPPFSSTTDRVSRSTALPKVVVGIDQEPGFQTLVDQWHAGDAGQRVIVPGPLHADVGTELGRQVQRPRRREQDLLVALLRQIEHRRGDRRGLDLDEAVHLVDVDPAAGDLRADVRLVLVIGGDHFGFALRSLVEFLDRHLRAEHGARALEVRVDARHVVHDADAQSAVLLGQRRSCSQHASHGGELDRFQHGVPPEG